MKPYNCMLLAGFVFAALFTSGIAARAATFKVDTTADDAIKTDCDDATPNDCSLRGAVSRANTAPDHDDIVLPAGTYALSVPASCMFIARIGENNNGATVVLCLNSDLSIVGADSATTIIRGNSVDKVIAVSALKTASITGVTVREGGDRPLSFQSGGGFGILNHGTLTLSDSVVTENFGGNLGGGGLYNYGTLTVLRCHVTHNSANGSGGGIFNSGGAGAGFLNIESSTISDNNSGELGGGVANFFGGVTTITGSTISGNSAPSLGGSGGGISNYSSSMLTVTNSTISSNQADSGGGIHNEFIAQLRNVTITANTAGTPENGRGVGGGIYNWDVSTMRLQNTIIAGNMAYIAGPDCSAFAGRNGTLTSHGYNLIQNTANCDISGDLTGNITGQGALLGPLADNGGLTQTHTLLASSPALDTGNPAAPGSGGFACTALDQRGSNRLQDGDGNKSRRCDMGAFELAESALGFSFSGVQPSMAGNSNSAYALLYGSGFVSGMTVRLKRTGEADIVGSPVTVDGGGAVAATSFDLIGRSPGAWNVVVTNPDGGSKTITGGFTIEAGGAPQVWSDIVAPKQIRVGRPTRFTLFFGNRGSVDASAVPLRIALLRRFIVKLNTQITTPPLQTGQVRTDWSQLPLDVTTDGQDSTINIRLLIPIVPAGFTGTLEFTVEALDGTAGSSFLIRAAADPPFFHSTLDSQLIADLVAGARTYSQDVIGVPIPSELTPPLEQYVTNQLRKVVDNGRVALVANVGAQSQVYSRAQLLVDLARFGAVLAGAEPPSTLSQAGSVALRRESSHVAKSTIQEMLEKLGDTIVYLLSPTEAFARVLREGESERPGCEGEIKACVGGNAPGGGTLFMVICCPTGKQDCCEEKDKKPFYPVISKDPNDKVGAQGVGEAQFLMDEDSLRYAILFENLETATAAAQEVVITDQLDSAKIDFDTFSLGPISFGDRTVTPPPGLSQYSTSVDLRPAQDLLVGIDARLNKSTGVVTWRFTSIDPLTGQFTEDPLAGFLPPNVHPPEGDGRVLFTINPKVTDTPICNQASIVFDTNPAILTPQWCNTIDNTPPSSVVQSLSAIQPLPDFTVQWAGSDQGAGIGNYSIYVSTNGSPFVPWLENTTELSALFPGEAGRTYAFYSVAQDLVGNLEAAPAQPDTSTRVAGVGGEICGNCADDDSDGKIDWLDGDCLPAVLAVKKGSLNSAKLATGDEKIALSGSFAAAALDPPTAGVVLSFIRPGAGLADPDIVLACVQIPPRAQGWKTDRTGTKWTFRDTQGGPLGDPNSKDMFVIKYNAKQQRYDIAAAITEAEVGALTAGVVSTQLSSGELAWENTQGWRLKAKGKQLVTP